MADIKRQVTSILARYTRQLKPMVKEEAELDAAIRKGTITGGDLAHAKAQRSELRHRIARCKEDAYHDVKTRLQEYAGSGAQGGQAAAETLRRISTLYVEHWITNEKADEMRGKLFDVEQGKGGQHEETRVDEAAPASQLGTWVSSRVEGSRGDPLSGDGGDGA